MSVKRIKINNVNLNQLPVIVTETGKVIGYCNKIFVSFPSYDCFIQVIKDKNGKEKKPLFVPLALVVAISDAVMIDGFDSVKTEIDKERFSMNVPVYSVGGKSLGTLVELDAVCGKAVVFYADSPLLPSQIVSVSDVMIIEQSTPKKKKNTACQKPNNDVLTSFATSSKNKTEIASDNGATDDTATDSTINDNENGATETVHTEIDTSNTAISIDGTMENNENGCLKNNDDTNGNISIDNAENNGVVGSDTENTDKSNNGTTNDNAINDTANTDTAINDEIETISAVNNPSVNNSSNYDIENTDASSSDTFTTATFKIEPPKENSEKDPLIAKIEMINNEPKENADYTYLAGRVTTGDIEIGNRTIPKGTALTDADVIQAISCGVLIKLLLLSK